MKAAWLAGCILGLVIATVTIVKMFLFVSNDYEPGAGGSAYGSGSMLNRIVVMIVGFIIFLVCYKKGFGSGQPGA